jgi:hypothetical protein
MTGTKDSLTVLGLVAAFACLSAAGTEPNDANTPLTFEMSPIVLPAPPLRQVRAMQAPWNGMVTYVAGVPGNDSRFLPRPYGRPQGFIHFVLRQDISREQRRFLETTEGGMDVTHTSGPIAPPDYYIPPEDPNAPQLLLYAVSLDDAKKMAEAYLQYARERFQEQVTPIQKEFNTLSEKLASEQQKLPEAIQAYEAARKAFEDLEKQVPYRDDKQALDAAAELDKVLNMAQVDIAGIRARIEAIQNEQQTHPSTAVTTQLQIMFVEEAVALKGTEARRNMATILRKQADSYIDLKSARDRAEAERDRLTQDVSVLPEMIRRVQETLAAAMQDEPRIIHNKVFIHPVRQETPPAPRSRIQP